MIFSNVFYQRFDEGFEPVAQGLPVRRLKGKVSKYELPSSAGPVQIIFRVNPKASAIPHMPGEFWPVITAPASLRSSTPDDSETISWYQYTSETNNREVQALQRRVYEKTAVQEVFDEFHRNMRDLSVLQLKALVELPLEARLPHTALYYLDGDDAQAWGALFAAQLPAWLARFQAAPETLERYMWRVHWASR